MAKKKEPKKTTKVRKTVRSKPKDKPKDPIDGTSSTGAKDSNKS